MNEQTELGILGPPSCPNCHDARLVTFEGEWNEIASTAICGVCS